MSISEGVLKRALLKIKMLRGLYVGNDPEVLLYLGEIIQETCRTDENVERGLNALLERPEWKDWQGPQQFREDLQAAVWKYGMIERDGKWVPHPANGPEFDVIDKDGKRSWWGDAYLRERWTRAEMAAYLPPPAGRYLRLDRGISRFDGDPEVIALRRKDGSTKTVLSLRATGQFGNRPPLMYEILSLPDDWSGAIIFCRGEWSAEFHRSREKVFSWLPDFYDSPEAALEATEKFFVDNVYTQAA